MYAAAWTTVIGFGILAVLVYFISNRWYPVPYEWRRLIVLGVAAAATLGGGWAIGWASGLAVDLPLGRLVARELLVTPALLLFPLVLWAGRFFTPAERQRLTTVAGRLAGRRAVLPATASPGGALAAAAAGAAGGAQTGAAAGGDHASADSLTEDDLEAEEEDTEIEAEVDIAEGGSVQI